MSHSSSKLTSFVTLADLQVRAVTCLSPESCYENGEFGARAGDVEATFIRVFTQSLWSMLHS